MPQQSEQRLLSGGINTDNAPYAIPQDGLLNAVNLRGLRKGSQSSGEREFIEGNVIVHQFDGLILENSELVGKTKSDNTGCLYYLYRDNTGFCYILEYNTVSGIARTVFDDTLLISGGLGWEQGAFVSCDVDSDRGLLFFSDGVTDIKYIDLNRSYSIYTTQEQISLIPTPGIIPLTATRVGVVGASSSIQRTPVQFTYRITNSVGFVSVLAPFSLTSQPARDYEIVNSSEIGNTIDVKLPLAQHIPNDWKRIDIVSRFLDTNTFQIIKTFSRDNSLDLLAVNNHNSGTQLSFIGWVGAAKEVLDPQYAAKQFDAIPLSSKFIKLAANRLFAFNNLEGYNTPSTDISLSISSSTFSTVAPITTTINVYFLFVKKYNVDLQYFAVVLREGTTNYLLPKECSIGSFINGNFPNPNSGDYSYNLTLTDSIFSITKNIHRSALIKLDESGDFLGTSGGSYSQVGPADFSSSPASIRTIRQSIIVEANGLSNFESEYSHSSTFDHWCVLYNPIIVEDDALYVGAGGQTRALLNGANYNFGIQLYDEYLRKGGEVTVANYVAPNKTSFTGLFVEKLTMTPSSSSYLPDWADYFSIVVSKNQSTSASFESVGGLIKTALIENDIQVYRGRSEYPTTAVSYFKGIAFPMSRFLAANIGYVYQIGDIIDYSYYDSFAGFIQGTLVISNSVDGYIIASDSLGQHTQILDMLSDYVSKLSFSWTSANWMNDLSFTNLQAHPQTKVEMRIRKGVQADNSLYEVAAFGQIVGGIGNKTFGNFFSTHAASIDILGDCYLGSNSGVSGALTVLTYSDAANNNNIFVGDFGRIAPIDTVGQKNLFSSFRFSNSAIPGASTNGYGSFDANDTKTADAQAGGIIAALLTTRDIQDGGQMLILSEHGSFAGLIGQQTIRSATGAVAFTSTVDVIGDLTPLRGGYGCQSPRSAIAYGGKAWWADAFNNKIIEFNEAGAGVISNFGMARAFSNLLGSIPKESYPFITCCINEFTSELMVTLPLANYPKPNLVTVPSRINLIDGVDEYVQTWFYNWESNTWVTAYTSGAEMINVGNDIYGWQYNKVWKEFISTPLFLYGEQREAILVIPFSNPKFVKSPTSLHLNGNTKPDETWIVAGLNNDSITSIQPYKYREGSFVAAILRERNSGLAANETQYQKQSLSAYRLKDKTISVVLIWQNPSTPLRLSDATLKYDVSLNTD